LGKLLRSVLDFIQIHERLYRKILKHSRQTHKQKFCRHPIASVAPAGRWKPIIIRGLVEVWGKAKAVSQWSIGPYSWHRRIVFYDSLTMCVYGTKTVHKVSGKEKDKPVNKNASCRKANGSRVLGFRM